jgi:hypothetical protein
MRWSEWWACAGRVDLKASKVEVVEQLIRLDAGEWIWRPPKAEAGVRTIAISPFTARMLVEHMDRFSAPGPDGLVYVNRADGPLIGSSWCRRDAALSPGAEPTPPS